MYYKYSWTRFYFKMKQSIFYNSFIRFVLQSALKMEIGFALTLTTLHWKNKKDKSQIIFSGLMMFLLVVVIPVVFAVVLFRRRKELWRPSVKAEIGSMYLGLNTNKVLALAYTIVFMVRRTLFVLIMFFLSN